MWREKKNNTRKKNWTKRKNNGRPTDARGYEKKGQKVKATLNGNKHMLPAGVYYFNGSIFLYIAHMGGLLNVIKFLTLSLSFVGQSVPAALVTIFKDVKVFVSSAFIKKKLYWGWIKKFSVKLVAFSG